MKTMDNEINTDPENSVLIEAHGLVHGVRNIAYDHPLENYRRVVKLFEAFTGIKLTPAQGVQFMMSVKMSRMMHKPARDHYVDLAGYTECLRMINEREARDEAVMGIDLAKEPSKTVYQVAYDRRAPTGLTEMPSVTRGGVPDK